MEEFKSGLDFPVCCNVCLTEMKMTGPNEWLCPNCGNHAFREEDADLEDIYYERNQNDDYDEYYTDDRPEGCKVCDSDMYPICMEGCNLIKD